MRKRGRPRHPDILTPREWEVQALLRDGLSNEEIAGRLGITLAGAKYHVSEILGKLGVESRHEAAAWSRGQRAWWQAGFAPLAGVWQKAGASWLSGTVAAGLAIALVAGIGLLAWGLVRTGGDGEPTSSAITIPPPPPVGPAPPGQAISFAPGEVIDTAPGVFYVDLDTGAVEGWWGFWPQAISPDGRYIFYDSQRFIDTESGGACAVAAEVSGSSAFALDSERFVANWAEGVAVFSTECGETPTALDVPTPGRLAEAAWSPDGTKILMRLTGVGTPTDPKLSPQALYLADLKRNTLQVVQSGPQADTSFFEWAFDWAADSSAFVLTTGATVGTFDSEGGPIWSTVLPVDGARNPRFSPNGEFVSVHGDIDVADAPSFFSFAAYILDGRTGEILHTLEDTPACWGNPWTADGMRLALQSQTDDPSYRLLNVDGSVDAIVSSLPFFGEPSPSDPDLIAYLDRDHFSGGLVGPVRGPLIVWTASTGEERALVAIADEITPEWDPLHGRRWLTDGRLVLRTVEGGGHGGCFV